MHRFVLLTYLFALLAIASPHYSGVAQAQQLHYLNSGDQAGAASGGLTYSTQVNATASSQLQYTNSYSYTASAPSNGLHYVQPTQSSYAPVYSYTPNSNYSPAAASSLHYIAPTPAPWSLMPSNIYTPSTIPTIPPPTDPAPTEGLHPYRAPSNPVPQRADDPNLVRTPDGALTPCPTCNRDTSSNTGPAALEPLPVPQEPDYSNRDISRAAWGCRRLIVDLYQNCEAAKMNKLIPHDYKQQGVDPAIDDTPAQSSMMSHRPQDYMDGKQIAGSAFYMPKSGYAPGCLDRSKSPPVFYVRYASRVTRDASGHVTVHADDVVQPLKSSKYQTPLIAINCSGAMKSCLASAGLKLRTSGEYNKISAYQFANLDLLEGKKACMGPVTFTPEESIRSGDIFALAPEALDEDYGHSMMIESVGSDPWGLEKQRADGSKYFQTVEDCKNNIRFSFFDFTLIQSGDILNRPAMTRMSAYEFLLPADQSVRDYFFTMARKACFAKVTGTSYQAAVGNGRGFRTYAFVRHRDTPECVEQPASLGNGEKCVLQCTNLEKGAPPGFGAGGK